MLRTNWYCWNSRRTGTQRFLDNSCKFTPVCTDGIGDTAYVIEGNETDNCPLMGLFSSFRPSLGDVGVVSNSTIQSFEYFQSNSTIGIHVTNMTTEQTSGFCRVCISNTLMNVDSISIVLDDGLTPVLYANYMLYDNGTHRWIYFAYEHSTHKVDIIPEFPSFLIPPLFMVATLLAVILHKRKQPR